jgi:chorismate mutase/prephenate dehydratase
VPEPRRRPSTAPGSSDLRRRSSAEPESPGLRQLRDRIDRLDRRIVALLNERARLGLAIGGAKDATGRRAVRDPEREREVLEHVAAANEGPLSPADLDSLYRRMMAATRRLELDARRAAAMPRDAEGPRAGRG